MPIEKCISAHVSLTGNYKVSSISPHLGKDCEHSTPGASHALLTTTPVEATSLTLGVTRPPLFQRFYQVCILSYSLPPRLPGDSTYMDSCSTSSCGSVLPHPWSVRHSHVVVGVGGSFALVAGQPSNHNLLLRPCCAGVTVLFERVCWGLCARTSPGITSGLRCSAQRVASHPLSRARRAAVQSGCDCAPARQRLLLPCTGSLRLCNRPWNILYSLLLQK